MPLSPAINLPLAPFARGAPLLRSHPSLALSRRPLLAGLRSDWQEGMGGDLRESLRAIGTAAAERD